MTITTLDLGRADDIAPGTSKRFVIDGHRIAVVRIDDDFYAIGDTCTHADYSLAEGEIDCEERTVECWKHGALFSLETGEALTLPATRPTPVYEVFVADGELQVVITHE
jgi:3-phenylpropionate/trans-cinnamate dioxygenase ferredoxin subunit